MKRIYLFCICLLFILPVHAQDWDTLLSSRGYIDIAEMDPTIRIHLMYAYQDNFMRKAVYTGITKAWLQPEAAKKLIKAQQLLKEIYPQYSLIVYDAARPMSVQRKMWDLVRGTDKTNYVSNPANGGGLHNYGMAVDVSIIDNTGNPLPMGSVVDFFGEEAHTNKEESLVQKGKITQEEFKNRRLLRKVMTDAGFRTILYEWWHFNACSRAEARERLAAIE